MKLLGSVILVLLGLLVASPVWASDHSTSGPVSVTTIGGQVDRLEHDLDCLRRHMGRRVPRALPYEVHGAQAREVYFQALAFYRKVDRLCFENVRLRGVEPAPPNATIEPADIAALLSLADERLALVKRDFGIHEKCMPHEPPPLENMDALFLKLARVNRLVNGLLREPVSPSDVYQQVTVAIAYAERLLEQTSDEAAIPAPPLWEPNKTPQHVYRRLLICLADTGELDAHSTEVAFEFSVPLDQEDVEVEPSDVYDLAALMVSELRRLHSQQESAAPPRKAYHPGRKFPSDVYQRVGILEEQLRRLRQAGSDQKGA